MPELTPRADYQMINSFEINNFRCFKDVAAKDCKCINLIVGPNGAGKTSLLEALFLASGSSVEIALRLRRQRGYDPDMSGFPEEIEEALWGELFYKFNRKLQIRISLAGSEYRNRNLTVKFNVEPTKVAVLKRSDDGVQYQPITFDWTGPLGQKHVSKPSMDKSGELKFSTAPNQKEETFLFPASHTASAFDLAKRFSDLSKSFRKDRVTVQLQEHFKDIEDLSVELVAGKPMVCARVAGLPTKIPLNSISSGMTKIASILFSISSRKGGVVLIDEIENGIHHRRFPVMWQSLLTFAKESDAQVFATTHSAECLESAGAIAKEKPLDFSVIRVGPDGSLRQFTGEKFAAAIEEDIEIR